jgi:rubrerythrin
MKKKASTRVAKKSLREERKAIKDYSNRSKKSDKKLKKIYHHVIPEEREHARMFKSYLKGKKKR